MKTMGCISVMISAKQPRECRKRTWSNLICLAMEYQYGVVAFVQWSDIFSTLALLGGGRGPHPNL